MIQLSEQAKWYLRGEWPIYVNENPKPEPKALQELASKGIIIELKDLLKNKCWHLTEFGRGVKACHL